MPKNCEAVAGEGAAHLLLRPSGMYLRRCAWHPLYHPYGKLLGIASWRGWRLTFSDGLCEGCAARVRDEWGLPTPTWPAALRPSRRLTFPYATAALAASIAVVVYGLALPPRDDVERPLGVTVLRPQADHVMVAAAPKPVTSAAPQAPARDAVGSALSHAANRDVSSNAAPRVVVRDGKPTDVTRPVSREVASTDAKRVRRVRSGIVRVSAPDRPIGERAIVPASAKDVASSLGPLVLFVASAPALVEVQAP